ncbi:MAG: hypothetical protein UR28_C0023G0013 [Candidatus Peregrinibacteria bacterium GW2011_GWF2_33_10]|nr:MAG: hypothetical protein UR28_C0023G0013 [Candidatus Peregrinibacteria bacterium GW2011_GWF2_33_10]
MGYSKKYLGLIECQVLDEKNIMPLFCLLYYEVFPGWWEDLY